MNIPKLVRQNIMSTVMAISLLAVTFAGISFSPHKVFAVGSAGSQSACSSLDTINSSQSCGSSGQPNVNAGQSTVVGVASKVVSILSEIVGVVAVIMIIVAGFQYITSGGDSNAVNKAKHSLIYGLIGLVVVALAQFMVHYVLNKVGA